MIARRTTPGTRVAWSTLREWLAAWRRIDARHCSSSRGTALEQHAGALPAHVVEAAACNAGDLTELESLVRKWGHVTPVARLNRARLLDAIDRARNARRHRPLKVSEGLAWPEARP